MASPTRASTILILLLLGGCGGGGKVTPPAEMPPVISSVSPQGLVGLVGAGVSFSADTANDPTSWRWHFAGGVTPTDVTEASPHVSFTGKGMFSGTVVACNEAGCSASKAFSYQIGPNLQPRWLGSLELASDPISAVGQSLDIALLADGTPVVAFLRVVPIGSQSAVAEVDLAVASAPAPDVSTPWEVQKVGELLNGNGDVVLSHHLGKICLVTTGDPRLFVAKVPKPTNQGDWDVSTLPEDFLLCEAVTYHDRLALVATQYDVPVPRAARIVVGVADPVAVPSFSDWRRSAFDVPNLNGRALFVLSSGELVLVESITNVATIYRITDAVNPSGPSDWDSGPVPTHGGLSMISSTPTGLTAYATEGDNVHILAVIDQANSLRPKSLSDWGPTSPAVPISVAGTSLSAGDAHVVDGLMLEIVTVSAPGGGDSTLEIIAQLSAIPNSSTDYGFTSLIPRGYLDAATRPTWATRFVQATTDPSRLYVAYNTTFGSCCGDNGISIGFVQLR